MPYRVNKGDTFHGLVTPDLDERGKETGTWSYQVMRHNDAITQAGRQERNFRPEPAPERAIAGASGFATEDAAKAAMNAHAFQLGLPDFQGSDSRGDGSQG